MSLLSATNFYQREGTADHLALLRLFFFLRIFEIFFEIELCSCQEKTFEITVLLICLRAVSTAIISATTAIFTEMRRALSRVQIRIVRVTNLPTPEVIALLDNDETENAQLF